MSDIPKLEKDVSLLAPKKKVGTIAKVVLLGSSALTILGIAHATPVVPPTPAAIGAPAPVLLEKQGLAPLILKSAEQAMQIAGDSKHSSHSSHRSHSSHSSHRSRSR